MIDRKKIAEWTRITSEATPGPWRAAHEGVLTRPDGSKTWEGRGWVYTEGGDAVTEYAGCGSHEAEWPNPSDASLVIASREALPALLAEREEMLAVLREMRASVSAALVQCYEGDDDTIRHVLRRALDDPRLASLLGHGEGR